MAFKNDYLGPRLVVGNTDAIWKFSIDVSIPPKKKSGAVARGVNCVSMLQVLTDWSLCCLR